MELRLGIAADVGSGWSHKGDVVLEQDILGPRIARKSLGVCFPFPPHRHEALGSRWELGREVWEDIVSLLGNRCMGGFNEQVMLGSITMTPLIE